MPSQWFWHVHLRCRRCSYILHCGSLRYSLICKMIPTWRQPSIKVWGVFCNKDLTKTRMMTHYSATSDGWAFLFRITQLLPRSSSELWSDTVRWLGTWMLHSCSRCIQQESPVASTLIKPTCLIIGIYAGIAGHYSINHQLFAIQTSQALVSS